MSEEVTFSDMARFRPADRLNRAFRKGCWKLIDYETEDGLQGTMACADPVDSPEEISLDLNSRLNLRGKYHIYVGINYPRSPYGDVLHHVEFPLYGQTWIKLSDDIGFTRFSAEIMWRHAEKFGSKVADIPRSIQETYWKTADLDGQSLIVSMPKPPYNGWDLKQIANISYVRFVPARGDLVCEKPSTQETKRLALLWCTGMLTGHTVSNPMYHPTDRQWFQDEFSHLVDSDLGIFVFEAIRGNLCTFMTKIGDVGTEDGSWPAEWIDPLKVFTELAHEHGMKIFVSMRMIGRGLPMCRNPISWGRFVRRHPEWTKRNREGVLCSGLSLVFPEVRTYWIGLLREALDYGIDGVQIHLNRSFPYVSYEEPTVESFKEKHGEDPLKLPDDDPRWLEHMASYVTQFLREVRALVKEKSDRHLAVTFIGGKFGTGEKVSSITRGCDVDTWAREGIVDYLMPSPAVDGESIRKWKALSGGSIQVYPDLMPRTQPGEAYAALAQNYYEWGADGLCLWDGERRYPRSSEWAVLRKLGHRNDLEALREEALSYYRNVPLKYFDGLSVKGSFSDG